MPRELWFDVYGRFGVLLRPGTDGWSRAHLGRSAGRRHALDDPVIPIDATDVEIRHAIEATYHELARPASDIRPVGSRQA